MKIEDYTLIIPSSEPQFQRIIYNYLVGEIGAGECLRRVRNFNGRNYPSFSKLVNDCILSATAEVVIICSDRMLPSRWHIDKTLALLNEGYGLVGLYRFGFFGFTRHLIKTVGFFDECYTGGEFEDCDYIRRLKEADIAYYESEEVPYRPGQSRWRTSNKEYYESKWSEDEDTVVRRLPEPTYDYDLGICTPRKFLKWESTRVLPWSEKFKFKKITKEIEDVL